MTVLEGFSHDLAAAGERLARRDLVRRRHARFAALAVAAILAIAGAAVAATAIWQPQLGDDRRGHPTASGSAPPADQLEHLGVLRRDQTDADRGAQSRYALSFQDPSLKGIRTAYVRLLGTRPDGRGYVLIPVASWQGIRDALCLWDQDVEGGGQSCFSTEQIRDGRATMLAIAIPPELRRPRHPIKIGADGLPKNVPPPPMPVGGVRYSGLVPDGVASVELRNAYGAARARVHDNFFASGVAFNPADPNRRVQPGDTPAIRWLDADGNDVTPASMPTP